jgi:hypothetical protein
MACSRRRATTGAPSPGRSSRAIRWNSSQLGVHGLRRSVIRSRTHLVMARSWPAMPSNSGSPVRTAAAVTCSNSSFPCTVGSIWLLSCPFVRIRPAPSSWSRACLTAVASTGARRLRATVSRSTGAPTRRVGPGLERTAEDRRRGDQSRPLRPPRCSDDQTAAARHPDPLWSIAGWLDLAALVHRGHRAGLVGVG